jgi:hypothetical protein
MRRPIDLCHQRNGEIYLFRFRPERADELREKFAEFAARSDLAFDWSDASFLGDTLDKSLLMAPDEPAATVWGPIRDGVRVFWLGAMFFGPALFVSWLF